MGGVVNKWIGKGWQQENFNTGFGGYGIPGVSEYQFLRSSGEDWQEANKEIAQEEQQAKIDAAKQTEDVKNEILRHNKAIEDANAEAVRQQEEMMGMQEEYLGLQTQAYQDELERLKAMQKEADAEKALAYEKTKRRVAAGASGRKSTILTGGSGSTGKSSKKTLLGQ